MGDYAALVALAILVYRETGDAVATSSLFIAAQFLPAFVAPALTARIDQLSARRVLPSIYVAEGLIFAALAAIADNFVLAAVLALALLDGTLMLTARGLTRAALNATLEPAGLLREGNSLLNIGFAIAGVSGAALGGVLVDAYGVSTALLLDAASFLFIAALLATTSHLPHRETERETMRVRLVGGFRYARANRWLRVLMSGEGLAIFCFTLVVPIEVIYARESLGTDETGYGLLLSSWGLGAVLGSLTYVVLKHWRSGSLILFSTALIGVAYLGMSAVDELAPACAFSGLGGLGNGVQWVSVMTAVQEATPGDLQARITGLLESIASVATGAGFLAGGILTALLAPDTTFMIAGLSILLLVVIALAIRTRVSRRVPAEAPSTSHDGRESAPLASASGSGAGSNTITFAATAIIVVAAVANALRSGSRRR